MKNKENKRKIIEATITCIEKFGIDNLTIRNIAKESGITLSSIHYYFESKEELVQTSLITAMTHSFEDMEDIWKMEKHDFAKALFDIFEYLFEGAIKFPGITRACLYPVVMLGENTGFYIERLNLFLEQVSSEIAKKNGKDLEAIKILLIQGFSIIFFLGVSPDSYINFSGLSFHDQSSREKVIENLLSKL